MKKRFFLSADCMYIATVCLYKVVDEIRFIIDDNDETNLLMLNKSILIRIFWQHN